MATPSRSASEVATAILNFNLLHPTIVENQDSTLLHTFRGLLENSGIENLKRANKLEKKFEAAGLELEPEEPSSISRQVENAGAAYDQLFKALLAIQDGKATLFPKERAAISDAAKLIELLAKESEFLGGFNHDESTRSSLRPESWVEGMSEVQKQGVIDSYSDRSKAQSREHTLTSNNLRTQILPLFRELAQALKIPFNEPGQARRN
jgi:hypothetical protein